MTIQKKMKSSEELRKKIIEKGAGVKEHSEELEKEYTHICIRIPSKLKEQVNVLTKKRAGFWMTTWICEAIQEKIKREKD